ncbi:hypothetical protein [Bacillus cereus]|uniref:hypothetical protein n=1 Tax=Bacillus cereus TaxID=1396 RepID=UPI001E4B6F1A|nr:hypothetical protein [Bacillus cereus]MCD1206037.1 hypothetical protein [Bacillus cereus]HDR4551329.1 hypothetical protein [Bacillus cereus]
MTLSKKTKSIKLFTPKVNSKYGFLQFFSDPNPATTVPNDPPAPNDQPKATHTDEDVQRMITEALAKAQAEAEAKAEKERQEAERKNLEEQEKYKELYQNLEKQVADSEAKALDAKKETLLVGAGYAPEQVVLVKDLLKGNSEDELKASLESVKQVILPLGTGADPSPGNSKRFNPEPTDPTDVGRNLYAELKAKGKL